MKTSNLAAKATGRSSAFTTGCPEKKAPTTSRKHDHEDMRSITPRETALLLAGSLPWLGVLAWLASLAWFLCDDAFISFRYVRNLVEGHGLVFNPGERVEGYSNFLWVLELAALWKIFGLRPEDAARGLSVAYTIGTLAATVWWATRLPGIRERALVCWMALGLLCTSATFAVWTSAGGLETRQFTFFVVAAAVCVTVHAGSRWGTLAGSLSLGAAAYTRPEGLLIAICCFSWFFVQQMLAIKAGASRGRCTRDLAWLILPCVALVAGHFLFRYMYYGEWLPNTYFAKHIRPWYESGFYYLWSAALETGLYVLAPLALLAMRRTWRARRDLGMALPLVCVAPHMAYMMRIGGDFIEYRPLDFYWPLLVVPAAAGIAHVGSLVAVRLRRLNLGRYSPPGTVTCSAIVFIPVLFYANSLQGELLLQGARYQSYEGWYSEKFQLDVGREKSGWLFAAPGMEALVLISNNLRRGLVRQGVATRAMAQGVVADRLLDDWRPYYGRLARGVIPSDAVTVVGALGIQSYFLPDLRIVDAFGLADKVVARNPVAWPNSGRLLAHDRRPPPGYLLEQRGVNIWIHPAEAEAESAIRRGAYALEVGPSLWMPFDAADHDWVLARFERQRLQMRDDLYSGWRQQIERIQRFESDPAAIPCEPGAHVLCLRDRRYRVTVDWYVSDGVRSPARVSGPRTTDAGVFFFFSPANWEVMVKVLDACESNGHHWVSVASATDLGFDVVVQDVRSGAERQYVKPPGEPHAFMDPLGFAEACRGSSSLTAPTRQPRPGDTARPAPDAAGKPGGEATEQVSDVPP